MMNRLDFWLAVMAAAASLVRLSMASTLAPLKSAFMASLRTGAARGPRDLMTSKYLPKLSAS